MATSENTQLLVKVIQFYINSITDNGKACPTIEQMKEIVKLDEIRTSLTSK